VILYLMRHGPAAQSSPDGSDASRPLSDKGREQTAAAARGLKRLGISCEIVSSPLLRATQTAQLAAECLTPGREVQISDELAAGAAPSAIVAAVGELEGDLLLVGHDPDFSELVTYLLTGGSATAIDFARAGVAAIEFDGPVRQAGGKLLWYVRRGQLALLAETSN
jgi:phosphohistidine phosphatase